jgi:hypothetical protein
MIEKQILRALVLEFLGRTPNTQVVEAINAIERLVAERSLFPKKEECERLHIDYHYYETKQLNSIDKLTINEIIWDLIQERIVTPGFDASNPDYPFFRLTNFGKDYIIKTAPHFYDPQGYLEFLKKIIPSLDPIIEQYVFESLNCYRQQIFFASAVMIGAAAEKAILLLLQAIHDSMQNPTNKKKVSQLLERPNLPDIYDLIIKTIEPLIKSNTIPYTVHRGSTEHLLSLFEMIRVQRNDAIHPTNGKVDRTKVFLSLQTIPTALECIYSLIGWFKANRIP